MSERRLVDLRKQKQLKTPGRQENPKKRQQEDTRKNYRKT